MCERDRRMGADEVEEKSHPLALAQLQHNRPLAELARSVEIQRQSNEDLSCSSLLSACFFVLKRPFIHSLLQILFVSSSRFFLTFLPSFPMLVFG